MRMLRFLLIAALAAPVALADGLPELGDASQSVFTPAMERRIGESIMERIRVDRAYLDDPEIADYLNDLGSRLVAASPDSRQAFEFFVIADPTVNAFAMPGGYIGVHTGLVLTAQSESELAAVLAHEVAHVTQRHIARMVAGQQRNQLASLAALALAILASRSSGQASQAILTGVQAASIQSQLDFTRDHEREADRVGFQILERAGFDVRAMPLFLERLQRANRVYDGSAPSYLRTHPVTFERIADLQNRTETAAYRQIPDNPRFQMVRAKLRAQQDDPRQALEQIEDALRERRFISEAAMRYSLVSALVRTKDYGRARTELGTVERLRPADPSVATLKGRLLTDSGDAAAAEAHYTASMRAFPHYRGLRYDFVDLLVRRGRADRALALVDEAQAITPGDARLFALQARCYEALGRRTLQHRAQAEFYVRQGNLAGAIEQLQIALRAGDGDFYLLSSVEARLRGLRAEDAERRKQQQQQ